MELLKNTIAYRYKMGMEMAEEIAELFISVSYPKHSFMIQCNDMSNRLFYISRGLAREYYYIQEEDSLEESNTTQFLREGDFYFSMDSLFENKPAQCYTQIIEPVKAYIIERETIERELERSPIYFRQFINFVLRDCLIRQNQRISIFMKSRRSIDRYENFVKEHPELSSRLSDKLIASYLGINSSTLSRIRSKSKF
ncbi:Crp/Fnr family transcriptional regulator [Jiulongibacter sediminis]|nr:Crp/Fnr family transcriptional regulator [Jiulongibacter sediminis]